MPANNKKVLDFTIDRKCSKCGHCCTMFLPITRQEKGRIRGYIAEHNIEPTPLDEVDLDIRCPFLGEVDEGGNERICKIHPVRPRICREFICNMNPATIGDWKMKMHKRGDITDFRAAFYGDDSMHDWYLDVIKRAQFRVEEQNRMKALKRMQEAKSKPINAPVVKIINEENNY